MTTIRPAGWRLLFLLSAPLLLAGGIQHPTGTMAQMLADPEWVRAHLLLLGGYAALCTGVVVLARSVGPSMRRWVRLAAVGVLLQCVEMAVHTAAFLDRGHLDTGASTPLLSIHRWLSILLHPVFGLTMIGLITAGARQRALGSSWIAWLGILGALGLGAANPLGFAGVPWAGRLYYALPGLVGWLILAAIWPSAPETGAASTFSPHRSL